MEETRQLNKRINIIKKLILICIGWRGFTHFRSPFTCNKNSISKLLYYWQEAWYMEFVLNKERFDKMIIFSDINLFISVLFAFGVIVVKIERNILLDWFVISYITFSIMLATINLVIACERYKFYKNENRNI